MHEEKAELLEGNFFISDFPKNTFLSAFLFKIDSSLNLDDLKISTWIDGDYYGRLWLPVSDLLCKWLKVSKYFLIPPDYHFSAPLFLQPCWGKMVHVTTYITKKNKTLSKMSFEPLGEAVPTGGLCFKSVTLTFGKKRWIHVLKQLPFVFVQIPLGEELNYVDISSETPFNLTPTYDPQIYLLIMSNILNSDKDCARLLREFLKRPYDPVWYNHEAYNIYLTAIRFSFKIAHFDVLSYPDTPIIDCPRFKTDLVHAVMFESTLN